MNRALTGLPFGHVATYARYWTAMLYHLKAYFTEGPLQEWLDRYFKYLVSNGMSLQSLLSQRCVGYALMYLIVRAEGRSMDYFWERFKKKDNVNNDHKVR